MIKLVISDSEGSTTVVPLVRDEISIGRKEGNTIRLTERNVSRHHAKLTRTEGVYKLEDLDSYVGTLVNGTRVSNGTEVSPGDTIAIGDYQIAVEQEGDVKPAAAPLDDEPTRVAQVRLPARLVLLGEPDPGEEFPLPEAGRVMIGRGEGLQIRIDHPSVSREHAVIERDGDRFVVRDLDSANGVRVGGTRVREVPLDGGDVISFGNVLVRFVPVGEPYIFDPKEAARHAPGRHRAMRLAAVVVLLLGVGIALGIASSGDEEPEDIVASSPVVEPIDEPEVEVPEPSAEPVVDEPAYANGVAACKEALAALRFAEAVAHANDALAKNAAGEEAKSCRELAERGNTQQQTFVRGKAALEAGDAEGAYRAFSTLDPASPFASDPVVARATEALGRARVAEARALLARNPTGAAELAGSVMQVPGMPAAVQNDARAVLVRAQASVTKAAAAPQPAAPRRATGDSAMKTASDCLARGDNACVVRTLRGRAGNAQELGLLIETYRAMGNSAEAEKNMRLYVKRYPTSRRAAAYRKMLEGP